MMSSLGSGKQPLSGQVPVLVSFCNPIVLLVVIVSVFDVLSQ